MNVTIGRSKASGTLKAQPSKSMAHRDIICAMLSDGESRVENLAFSEDILATMDCATALGAKVLRDGNALTIRGIGNRPMQDEIRFMCRESGSTMRFFMGIAMGLGCRARFYGSDTLLQRPFGVYETICSKQSILFERKSDHILIDGKLHPDRFTLPGDVSSQFVSGLLFALPLLEGDSKIILTPPVESRSYIALTIQALSDFGIDIAYDEEIGVPGGQMYRANTVCVEGDYSNAAFIDAFNLFGGDVEITGLLPVSRQGDAVYKEYFEALKHDDAKPDLSDCPDLGPVLFAVAAGLKGGLFTGTRRLRLKESDRVAAMCEELSKFGIRTETGEDFVRIHASTLHAPSADLDGHNDHRIVMALSVLLTQCGGTIFGAQAVKKSYPDFFTDLKSLGVDVIQTDEV